MEIKQLMLIYKNLYKNNLTFTKTEIIKLGYGPMTKHYFKKCCEYGYMPSIMVMVNRGANYWEYGLFGACYNGNLSAIDYMLSKTNNIEYALNGAFKAGNFKLGKRFIVLLNSHYSYRYAAYSGNLEILDFLNWKEPIELFIGACKAGNLELAKKLENKVKLECYVYRICKSKNIELIKYFIDKPTSDKSAYMEEACYLGLLPIVKYLINSVKITKDHIDNALYSENLDIIKLFDTQMSLEIPCFIGSVELVDYLLSIGINDLNHGLTWACVGYNQVKIKNNKFIDFINFDIPVSIYYSVISKASDIPYQINNNYIKIMEMLIKRGANQCSYCHNHKFDKNF